MASDFQLTKNCLHVSLSSSDIIPPDMRENAAMPRSHQKLSKSDLDTLSQDAMSQDAMSQDVISQDIFSYGIKRLNHNRRSEFRAALDYLYPWIPLLIPLPLGQLLPVEELAVGDHRLGHEDADDGERPHGDVGRRAEEHVEEHGVEGGVDAHHGVHAGQQPVGHALVGGRERCHSGKNFNPSKGLDDLCPLTMSVIWFYKACTLDGITHNF